MSFASLSLFIRFAHDPIMAEGLLGTGIYLRTLVSEVVKFRER